MFSATPEGDTLVNAVLNKNGINTHLLSAPVDMKSTPAKLIHQSGMKEIRVSTDRLLSSEHIAQSIFQLMK